MNNKNEKIYFYDTPTLNAQFHAKHKIFMTPNDGGKINLYNMLSQQQKKINT